MNSAPVCSVIVPIYRHEAYLRECLESVYAQSFRDIELILIDDLSPDASFRIASELAGTPRYRARFRRIICEQNAVNSGAHYSLNRGISLATGKYIAPLNSDDRYHPARLSQMVEEMQGQDSRFAFSAVDPFCGPGGQIHEGLLHVIGFLDYVAPRLPSLSFALLRHNCALSTGNFVIRRDLCEEVGEFIGLRLAHDWDFLLRAILIEEPLYIPEALYDYRLHPDNTFSAVADRAMVETQACLTRYFRAIARGPTRNRLAPSPLNWPQIFEHYLKTWKIEHLWQQVSTGHVASGRMLEKPSSARITTARPRQGMRAEPLPPA